MTKSKIKKIYDTLVWNVYDCDFNAKKVEERNVFQLSVRFDESALYDIYKYQNDYDELKKAIKSDLMYAYWSKCEYEIIITDWPTFISKEEVERLMDEYNKGEVKYRTDVNLLCEDKIDVYDQVMLNYDIFFDYLWNAFHKN